MNTQRIFDIVKAAKFFPKYAPAVKNWKHKLRGKDGNNKPIQFSDEDIKMIDKGVQYLIREIKSRNN